MININAYKIQRNTESVKYYNIQEYKNIYKISYLYFDV